MKNEVKEGVFEFKVPVAKLDSKMPGFYNPKKTFDRDLCIDILSILKPKRVCELLSATGARGIRIAGINGIEEVYMNDINPKAVELIKENIKNNKKLIKAKISVSREYAQKFLYNNRVMFDYIDIDPFGSPTEFLEPAVAFLKNNGYLGVTATDSAPLVGTYPEACFRKYHSHTFKTPYSKEVGIRILIHHIIQKGAEAEKALTPVFSYSKDDYFRVYFHCRSGAGRTDELLGNTGYILYCRECGFSEAVSRLEKINAECSSCRKPVKVIGPLYLGKLWDKELLDKIQMLDKRIDYIKSESEINVPWYIEIPYLKSQKIKSMKFEEIIKMLESKGYKVSRTHFSESAIRTDADIKVLK